MNEEVAVAVAVAERPSEAASIVKECGMASE